MWRQVFLVLMKISTSVLIINISQNSEKKNIHSAEFRMPFQARQMSSDFPEIYYEARFLPEFSDFNCKNSGR